MNCMNNILECVCQPVLGSRRLEALVSVERRSADRVGARIGEAISLHRLTIVAHRAGGPWVSQPELSTVLSAGDQVQIMVHGDRVAELHALNTPSG